MFQNLTLHYNPYNGYFKTFLERGQGLAGSRVTGHNDYLVEELPELNHLFQTSKTGLPSEYNIIEETFSPNALGLISGWILGLK